MKQFIKDIGREALRQLFGLQKPHGGKIVLSAHAASKMTEYKLDRETLENAFRHGRQAKAGKITHKYANYSVGLYYKHLDSPIQNPREPKDTYLITTCWRGR
jgi:hypothetical protein